MLCNFAGCCPASGECAQTGFKVVVVVEARVRVEPECGHEARVRIVVEVKGWASVWR